MGIYELVFSANRRPGHMAGWGGERNWENSKGKQWCPSSRRGLMAAFLRDDLSPIKVGGGPRREKACAMGEGL